MKKLNLLILVALIINNVFCQEDTLLRQTLSFVPQYLIKRGIRLDYDIKIKENHWLQICPQFYLGDQNYKINDYEIYSSTGNTEGLENENYKLMVGAGLMVYHKIFPNKNISRLNKISGTGFYISYGLSYNYFYTQFDVKSENDEINEVSHSINKIGGDVLIGFQEIFFEKLILDIYTGLGTRFSFFNPSLGNLHKFDSFYTSFGYTGNLMHLGLRIGIVL